MRARRLIYLALIVITIIIGLLSRHYTFIPLFIGDVLWATMVYFIVRFLFIHKPVKFVVIAGLAFSYAIEFSQLYSAPWIDELRKTLFGKLVLGSVFNCGDLLSYTLGIIIGYFVERLVNQWRTNSTTKLATNANSEGNGTPTNEYGAENKQDSV
jgi:hypothetical protein